MPKSPNWCIKFLHCDAIFTPIIYLDYDKDECGVMMMMNDMSGICS
jgi:hypothetical protein